MVTLESLGVSAQKQKQFEKKGIYSGEDLCRYLPKDYLDSRKLTGILPAPEISSFLAMVKSVAYRSVKGYIIMDAYTEDQEEVRVFWFNSHFQYNDLVKLSGKQILLVGAVTYAPEYDNYRMANPTVCTADIQSHLRIYPVYSKIPGMADAYLEAHLQLALNTPECVAETVPEQFRQGLMTTPETLRAIHFPKSTEDIEAAKKRLEFDDLLYFALRLELANNNLPAVSRYGVHSTDYMDKLLSSLPYQLTEDQQAAVDGMLRHIGSGQRLNALLQGDVGCGKTIVAFLMLCAIISSGCQGVLVAPTRQLASQHYQDMQELLVPLGIQVGYLGDATSKKAQRRKVLEGLADGSIQIAVGTHALFSPSVKFHDLGMVIVDEEHKFGVLQRESLVARANAGVHCITMSATPIPRSLAIAMYGSGLQVYSILTRPKGRMPVKTLAVAPDEMDRLNSFLRYQAASGHQTYVVCPAIEHGTSERMENVISVEQAYDWLKCFEAEGIHTEVLTGRTLKTESAEILERFRKNETQILLATSVIEVGINVPSATGIIILSAERFGLASLHQLRGRVGRGADQGYCIVYSPEAHSNPRLQALCKTTDGFKIAEEDLRLRGAGDFLGTQQSGDNRYVSLMLANPDKFQDIRKLARMSIDQNMNYPLMERAVADFRKPPEAD